MSLLIVSVAVLLMLFKEKRLEKILAPREIYAKELNDKIHSTNKSLYGNGQAVLIALCLYLGLISLYCYSSAIYINIPFYTKVVLGYYLLEIVETMLLSHYLINGKPYILAIPSIWLSKTKVLLEYVLILLTIALIIIK